MGEKMAFSGGQKLLETVTHFGLIPLACYRKKTLEKGKSAATVCELVKLTDGAKADVPAAGLYVFTCRILS